ncbi:type II secretion system inner membrane protein GspF [Bordetella sp. BOR01]|uniref:type II secretion system inner membrane protein GspF n=1 Tax=Bordetella sp. BOR01 TaxID=2854779 RepID=UPI001C44ACFA|nr:type II secretion system inner membrane protein GspF [Bordetella sp. BOR01]MBV7482792.1 type II secretion system inner membrane protein GspF [Bordetella sp. BOR01]
MPSFRYEATDLVGKIVHGTLDAETERGARNQLRARGLLPLSTAPAASRQGGASLLQRRLSDSELAWLTRQLSSLLTARLPLDAALSATLEQAESRHVAGALAGVRDEVRAGYRLADALATRPRDFPEIYRALVAAGEESGDLALVMEKLADYIEERNALRSKVMTAFIYPAVVACVSVVIVAFLLGYVVPQVITAFDHAHQQLPLLTRIMLALSDFVRHWGWATSVGGVAAFMLWRAALRAPARREAWHARLLRLPVIGRFVLGVDTARFASTLAILSSSGVSLLGALNAARRTLGNDRLRAAVDDAAERVRQGAPLAAALAAQKVFPTLLIHLIASGEKTGRLPELLERGAQNLSRDLERRAMAMTALLEPLLILLMGGFVLLIVLAVMMPILEMNQLVR